MILSCRTIVERIKKEVRAELAILKEVSLGFADPWLRPEARRRALPSKVPHLVSVQVGKNKDVRIYANVQKKVCEEIGIKYSAYQFKEISQKDLLSFIQKLNNDKGINSIIIHLPLPLHISTQKVFSALKLEKDVEGMHPQSRIIPCTPLAILEILKETKIKIRGKEIVIVGSSDCVGKPLFNLLLDKMATLSICNIATKDLVSHTKRADILIVAVGKPNFIKPEMVKKGVVVIDVGINYLDNKIVGDVDRKVAQKARFLTPVPGGVGPITTAMLMKNTLECFLKQRTENRK
jgi:methylenetetrahydrofolate dehydrogenase (NADP+)/methenyltetrahydrofolate cyclohydrolase